MARTKRETYLIIGVATAVGLFALDYFALTPYMDAHKAIDADMAIASTKNDEVNTLFKRERQMRRTWADMTAVGLQSARRRRPSGNCSRPSRRGASRPACRTCPFGPSGRTTTRVS